MGVLERLKAGDREVGAGEVVTLYQLFEDRLWHRAFNDDFADDLFTRFYRWAGGERTGLHAILADPSSRWWDDIGTVERRESRDDIFLLAADDAGRALAQLPSGVGAGTGCTPRRSPTPWRPAARSCVAVQPRSCSGDR